MREIDTRLSIDRPAAEFLYETVCELAPASAIEVGMAWGFSSVPICAALRDTSGGKSLIFDPFQTETYEGVGLELVRQSGLAGNCVLAEERSDTALPALFKSGHTTQFAFIDGDHRIDAVIVDFYYINKMLKPGGAVVFDDYQFSSVRRVVNFALAQFHYTLVPQPNARLAMLKRIASDDRGWDHYGDF